MNGVKVFSVLPYFCRGEIIKGFGRGSKELGIPTANFPESVVEKLPEELPTGVYYGWATVNAGPVFKMVMSIGWNPFYKNEKKSMETHVIHEFNRDLYGCTLTVAILGYLRPEASFPNVQELIEAIRDDITSASMKLDTPESRTFITHPYLQSSNEEKSRSADNFNASNL